MSLVLESKAGGDFKPHVEGIHPAVCVDVIDLGLVESEFQGQRRLVNKVRLFFEKLITDTDTDTDRKLVFWRPHVLSAARVSATVNTVRVLSLTT